MNVYKHPNTSAILQKALKHALPYSINLVYRTQHANQTEHTHILATFPPDADSVPECWAVAYLDRSVRPETELWMFTAGEVPGHCQSSTSLLTAATEREEGAGVGEKDVEKEKEEKFFCSQCKTAVLSLLDYMSTLPLPPLHATNTYAMDLAKQHEAEQPHPGPDGRYPASDKTYMRHLLLPTALKIGCCHESVARICQEAGLVRQEFPGLDAVLNKFLFRITDLPSDTRELPAGTRWGEVRERDLEAVRGRTSIPRSTKTLMSLKSLAVFDEKTDVAVAWTFLGQDGSLTTLHTEEGWRGKGIAKTLTAKLFRTYSPGLAVDEQGIAWSHADVYEGNIQSESVCRSLGGKAMWKCFWVVIDLEKAGSLAKSV